jgi:hypothetical protein
VLRTTQSVRTPRKQLPPEAFQAAAARGLVSIRISKLARAADLSEGTVRRWAGGGYVSKSSELAIERALGAERAPDVDMTPLEVA